MFRVASVLSIFFTVELFIVLFHLDIFIVRSLNILFMGVSDPKSDKKVDFLVID